jgi:3-dehydroquinate synthase
MGDATTITVGGDAPYDVVVGTDIGGALRPLLGDGVRQVLLVHPVSLAGRALDVEVGLRAAGHEVTLGEVPDGETAKTAEVAAGLWALLGRAGFTRSDAVVALGGGATTDLAGFVAATWLRGVAVVHLPTTLLAMVDAAVGGKSAIDTGEGKNLVGAFHPPAGVLCDLSALATLPREELAGGMAEVVKTGFIADPRILDLVESSGEAALDPGGGVLRELVERSVRVKAGVVAADLREAGGREVLNYGHTLAHAIEKVEDYTWRHGDAVSVGLVYAAELSAAAGRLAPSVVARHRALLSGLGLPTAYARARWPELLAAMRVDKKARGSRLRFVVLDDVARPGLLERPDEELLAATYEKVST